MSDSTAFNNIVSPPQVLDLFCGAGGFSQGFEKQGFDVLAGVDTNKDALNTYEKNHNSRSIQQDLTELSPSVFAFEYGIYPSDVDVMIGGPPCQGFSLANIDRSVDDDRNNLVFVFAEYVEYYQPDVFVMENVKGIQSVDDGTLFSNLKDDLRDAGYTVESTILNAADYGVPQTRERMFVQGVKTGSVQWPQQTHEPSQNIQMVVDGGNTMKPYVTVSEAFEGLPTIGPNETSEIPHHEAPTQRESTITRCRETEQGEQLYDSYETNKRLDANRPSFTIIGKDWKYAHPTEPRGITVRERARLQSFDDDFELDGEETSQRQQLANAVPVELAASLADVVNDELNS